MMVIVLACHGNGNGGAVSESGTVEVDEVSIPAKSGGQITSLFVDEGSRVKKGDTLAFIDTIEYVLNYRQALANVASAEAQLLLLEHGSRAEDIAQANDMAQQAKVQWENAQSDLKRIKPLAATGSATAKQLDDAAARVDAAEAAYHAAKQVADKVRRGAREEDVAAGRARVLQARAQADLINKKLNDCVVISPVTGTVTHRLTLAGEQVNPGAPLVTVSKLDTVKLTIYVNERELGRVKLGASAEVKIDAFPDKSFSGIVNYISPTAEFTPKNVQTKEDREKLVFAVKILLPNPDGNFKPGLPADAILK